MAEQNAAQALQDYIHEMIAQRKQGFRAGAGGDASGEQLWLYFSRGEAIESRLLLRAGLRNGKPVVIVDRLEGEGFQIIAKMNELQRADAEANG